VVREVTEARTWSDSQGILPWFVQIERETPGGKSDKAASVCGIRFLGIRRLQNEVSHENEKGRPSSRFGFLFFRRHTSSRAVVWADDPDYPSRPDRLEG
jgi:hypothetical protein